MEGEVMIMVTGEAVTGLSCGSLTIVCVQCGRLHKLACSNKEDADESSCNERQGLFTLGFWED